MKASAAYTGYLDGLLQQQRVTRARWISRLFAKDAPLKCPQCYDIVGNELTGTDDRPGVAPCDMCDNTRHIKDFTMSYTGGAVMISDVEKLP